MAYDTGQTDSERQEAERKEREHEQEVRAAAERQREEAARKEAERKEAERQTQIALERQALQKKNAEELHKKKLRSDKQELERRLAVIERKRGAIKLETPSLREQVRGRRRTTSTGATTKVREEQERVRRLTADLESAERTLDTKEDAVETTKQKLERASRAKVPTTSESAIEGQLRTAKSQRQSLASRISELAKRLTGGGTVSRTDPKKALEERALRQAETQEAEADRVLETVTHDLEVAKRALAADEHAVERSHVKTRPDDGSGVELTRTLKQKQGNLDILKRQIQEVTASLLELQRKLKNLTEEYEKAERETNSVQEELEKARRKSAKPADDHTLDRKVEEDHQAIAELERKATTAETAKQRAHAAVTEHTRLLEQTEETISHATRAHEEGNRALERERSEKEAAARALDEHIEELEHQLADAHAAAASAHASEEERGVVSRQIDQLTGTLRDAKESVTRLTKELAEHTEALREAESEARKGETEAQEAERLASAARTRAAEKEREDRALATEEAELTRQIQAIDREL